MADGRLLIQRARTSGRYFFPPRVAEPGTGDLDWEWVPAAGLGAIYSVTSVHPRPPEPPYTVVLVDLTEGVRVMGEVRGTDQVTIGMPVRVVIDRSAGAPKLVFTPV